MAQVQLTADQIVRINQALRDLHDATSDTAKLMACGVDCEARRVEIEQLTDRLTKLKEQFAPAGS